MEQVFTDILEKDEKIIKVWRPNKCKFWWFWGLSWFACLFWIAIIPIPFLWDDGGWAGVNTAFWIILGVCAGVLLLGMLLFWITGALWLDKRYYAYTQTRVLIRGGIIGVDYKSLEFKSLTATVVKVSLLDKMVRKDTGSIKFGSAASPVLSIWSGSHSNQYMFEHVGAPYATLREIKEYMNDHKEKT